MEAGAAVSPRCSAEMASARRRQPRVWWGRPLVPGDRRLFEPRSQPVLARVQGQGSEAAVVRVRKEERARGTHKEGKVRLAVRRPQLQVPRGSGPKIKAGQFFSEGRRIIFIPWCGGRLHSGSKIEVHGSIQNSSRLPELYW